MKHVIAAVTTVAVLLAGTVFNTAQENAAIAQPLAIAVATDMLDSSLEEEGIELDSFDIDMEEIELETSIELAAGEEIEYDFSLDIDTSDAVLDVSSTIPEWSEAIFEVHIEELNEERIEFTVVDPETNKEVFYDSEAGDYSYVILPVAIPAIAAMLKALLAAAVAVVIAGTTYVMATQLIPDIYNALKDRNGKATNHYMALRRSKGLFLGPGLTYQEAIQRVRSGQDTWSSSQSGASSVAAAVKGARAVGPERDANGTGKFCHYHPSNRKPASHAFYGTPATQCPKR